MADHRYPCPCGCGVGSTPERSQGRPPHAFGARYRSSQAAVAPIPTAHGEMNVDSMQLPQTSRPVSLYAVPRGNVWLGGHGAATVPYRHTEVVLGIPAQASDALYGQHPPHQDSAAMNYFTEGHGRSTAGLEELILSTELPGPLPTLRHDGGIRSTTESVWYQYPSAIDGSMASSQEPWSSMNPGSPQGFSNSLTGRTHPETQYNEIRPSHSNSQLVITSSSTRI
ncbi:hypothetical protein BU23DRAFT_572202 [Bimuria novae-zelandiae CBS 107.79]|uniref:Uncharacterized protein n=1 Tax=Bimuria novae-zelandiae CBS 107.79 TaxID=1447943 RepID=A0A6A5V5M0_9PLEO|nr:hypothetical protein BU23DRAFT_572202 [Bimuria novae-zelandiae CBS 107.79]